MLWYIELYVYVRLRDTKYRDIKKLHCVYKEALLRSMVQSTRTIVRINIQDPDYNLLNML